MKDLDIPKCVYACERGKGGRERESKALQRDYSWLLCRMHAPPWRAAQAVTWCATF